MSGVTSANKLFHQYAAGEKQARQHELAMSQLDFLGQQLDNETVLNHSRKQTDIAGSLLTHRVTFGDRSTLETRLNCNKYAAISSILIVISGVFLVFAAYKIVPAHINVISELGAGGKVLGFSVLTIGCIALAVSTKSYGRVKSSLEVLDRLERDKKNAKVEIARLQKKQKQTKSQNEANKKKRSKDRKKTKKNYDYLIKHEIREGTRRRSS